MATAVDTLSLPEDTIREAIEYISENLRPADEAEIEALQGPDADPFWTLFESWDLSTATWLILDRTGLPIGIFGVAPHTVAKLGVAWMMGTPGMEEEALSIARQTPDFIAKMHELYPALWADVDARNALSMRWLSWAGFDITDANPAAGVDQQHLFIEFTRTR